MKVTLHFNRKRTCGKTTAINAIVNFAGKKYTWATGIVINPREWDTKLEQAKNNREINRRLNEIKTTIIDYIYKNGHPPKTIKKDEALDIFEAIRLRGEKVIAETGKQNSLKAYTTLASKIKHFTTEEKRPERVVDDINEKYIIAFIAWLARKNYSSSHASKMIRTLRSVVRHLIPADRWNKVKPPQAIPDDSIYLTTEEIQKIENLDLEPTLDRARDLFLVGYYTAQRFSDWHQISSERIKTIGTVQVLNISQTKTKHPVTIPVTPRLQKIIDKYTDQTIPRLSNQKLNKHIKEIARKAGITQQVAITEHRGGKMNVKKYAKWELVSSHTARRSFATNAVLAGIPILEVMKFTGHRSMASFLQYVRITETQTAINYASHPFFNQ